MLVWDTDDHDVRSLELEGPLVHAFHTVRDPDQTGPTYESTFTVSGSAAIVVESEAVEHDG